MRAPLAGLAATLTILASAVPASAQSVAYAGPEAVVCPAAPGLAIDPDFADPACETAQRGDIDPQGRLIWVRTSLAPAQELLDSQSPLGLFVSAKASSEAWLNGVRIGANGTPGASRAEETPGRMDAVIYAPHELLRPGDNELVLRMSSHHGLLHLFQPVHMLALGPYGRAPLSNPGPAWPALITFGSLLAGALYFAVMSLLGEARRSSALLSLLSLFAAAQLLAEASRRLFAYAYPLHDVRLLLILLFALGFGLCLAAHVVLAFEDKRPRALLLAIAAATLLAVLVSPGFDQKSALALLVPTLACVAATGLWTWERKPGAIWQLAALTVFATAIMAAPTLFLDVFFYYAVAAFLLFLFVRQAFALADERRLRRLEAERASRLALVLEQQRAAQASEKAPRTIKVTSIGRIELVALDDVVYFKGAGDYVEIRLASGRELLHNGSLNDLETALPPTFVRVHRSHIVNTAHVRSLQRETSGVGRLILANGDEIPVSRRVLPKVRVALD